MKKKAMLLFAAGLLLVASTQLINHFFHLDDFYNGAMMGAGICIEIIAIIQLKRLRRANS